MHTDSHPTIITEVLDDGTIIHIDTDICDEASEDAIEFLLDKQDIVLSFDFTTAMFATFVKSIHILTQAGWSTEELLQEVCNHSEADDNDGDFLVIPDDGHSDEDDED